MSLEQIETAKNTLEAVKSGHGKNYLPLNLQLFASGADSDGADGAETSEGENKGNENNGDQKPQMSTEELEKYIQSQVDKRTADFGKTKVALQKEIDKLKKEKLTDDEIKKLEIADKEKALTEKEQALLEKENRLYAIKAIKENELDDGSDKTLELVDFVMGKDEKEIDAKVKAFKGLVDRFVNAKVDETFKQNGRVPNGGANGSNGGESKNNIAEMLGKQKAEQQQKSNEILNYYYGGKK